MNKPRSSGRTSTAAEQSRAIEERHQRMYGAMAQEKPEKWPEWMTNREALPKEPPGGKRLGT